MRKLLFSVALVFTLPLILHAQSIGPFVINSTGGSYNQPASNFNLDWSVGEMPLVVTMQTTGPNLYVLTNGFLQPTKLGHIKDTRMAGVTDLSRAEIKIYPNPVVSYVDVNLQLPDSGKVQLSVYNLLGRQVYAREADLDGGSHILHIPMTGLAQGTYFLNVEWESSGLVKKNAYKIIKLN